MTKIAFSFLARHYEFLIFFEKMLLSAYFCWHNWYLVKFWSSYDYLIKSYKSFKFCHFATYSAWKWHLVLQTFWCRHHKHAYVSKCFLFWNTLSNCQQVIKNTRKTNTEITIWVIVSKLCRMSPNNLLTYLPKMFRFPLRTENQSQNDGNKEELWGFS